MTPWDSGTRLATGRLFSASSPTLQRYAEALLGRPILTHEFADKATWAELREAFEASVLETK